MKLVVEKSNALKRSVDYLGHRSCFYSDCTDSNLNQITKEKLKTLADFSETIEAPYTIGKFNDEEHYLKTLELVLNSTLETQNRILFFLNKILPTVSAKDSLLDIGPGDGALTKVMAKYFKSVTAIDSNQHILDTLQQALPSSISYEKINKGILDVELTSNSYDMAILSHILYYINPVFWFNVVKSIYGSLKKNGFLVIVMGGDELGKGALIKDFGGQTLRINQLASNCYNAFGANNTNFYASNEAFEACSRKAMFHISAFLLGDANISTTKSKLNRYIETKFRRSEQYFVMTTRQKYIVIRKDHDLKDFFYGSKAIFTKNQSKN